MIESLKMLKLNLLRWLIVPMVRFKWRGQRENNLGVADRRIPVDGGEIAVRIYTPRGEGPFPLMVFFHGGGFVGCNLDTHDFLCRDLCVASRHVIVSVDYRLAPEHPFPIPVMDCIAALQWAHRDAAKLNADPTRLTICGDSAGGNLSAVVAIYARDKLPGMVKRQVLIYPVTDDGTTEYASYKDYGKGHALTLKDMKNLLALYTRGSAEYKKNPRHELYAPLHVKDLTRLPPAFVLTAEYDLLRDEGLAYGEAMKKAGNDVHHVRYAKQEHGFVGLQPSPEYRQAVGDIAKWLAASAVRT